jgi:hypothetical protein
MRFPILVTLLFVFAGTANAAFAPAVATTPEVETTLTSTDLSRDAVEAKLGRKLKFKERVALSIVRGKAKRAERRKAKGQNDGGVTDGFAIASLVCGVLGLFLLFPAIPALVFGIISLGKIEEEKYYRKGKGMAIAGIALGGVVILTFLLLVGIFALAFGIF